MNRHRLKPFNPTRVGQSLYVSTSRRAPAFSLAELVVSIAILVVMMGLAGRVFTLSVESTNQANAVIEMSQTLRNLEETLRADLAGIDPTQSMLVIRGQEVDAYWTRAQQDSDSSANGGDQDPAGYEFAPDPERADPETDDRLIRPRADILMFFTSAPTRSIVDPNISANIAMSVYGHAEIGQLADDGSWLLEPLEFPKRSDGALDDPQVFRLGDVDAPFARWLPASDWHLARRSVGVIFQPRAYLEQRFDQDTIALAPEMPHSPTAGDDLSLNLLTGEIDFIINRDVIDPDDEPSFFTEDVVDMKVVHDDLDAWLRRSKLDTKPPAKFRTLLGHYFLPNCASFKVEWALSDPRLKGQREIIWVDPYLPFDLPPGDPIPIVGRIDMMAANALGPMQMELEKLADALDEDFNPRNVFIDPSSAQAEQVKPHAYDAQTHVFFASDPSTPLDPDDLDPYFPRAIRITVDIFDADGSANRPRRHVMVLPVGADF
jgi:type II secretory pathway pseudopilin PulG